ARAFPRDATSDPYGPAAFSGAGGWLAIKASENRVEIDDPATGATYAALDGPASLLINNLGISADGTQIAMAGNDEIQHWNLPKLQAALQPFGLDWLQAGRTSAGTQLSIAKMSRRFSQRRE